MFELIDIFIFFVNKMNDWLIVSMIKIMFDFISKDNELNWIKLGFIIFIIVI